MVGEEKGSPTEDKSSTLARRGGGEQEVQGGNPAKGKRRAQAVQKGYCGKVEICFNQAEKKFNHRARKGQGGELKRTKKKKER